MLGIQFWALGEIQMRTWRVRVTKQQLWAPGRARKSGVSRRAGTRAACGSARGVEHYPEGITSQAVREGTELAGGLWW